MNTSSVETFQVFLLGVYNTQAGGTVFVDSLST